MIQFWYWYQTTTLEELLVWICLGALVGCILFLWSPKSWR